MFKLPHYPQNISQVLDTSFKLYKKSFFNILPFSLAISIIFAIPRVYRSGYTTPVVINGKVEGFVAHYATTESIILVVCMLLFFALKASIIARMNTEISNRNMSFESALTLGFKKLIILLAVFIINYLLYGIGLGLLIIPGLYLFLATSFADYFVVLTEDGVFNSIKHSIDVVWGHWWRTFVILLFPSAIYLLSIIVSWALLGVLVDGFEFFSPEKFMKMWNSDYRNVLATMGYVLTNTIIGPFIFATTLSQYYDLKLRKENLEHESKMFE